ncbi:mitochondrial adenine nucleotide transporter BTL3 [Tripterygium wilfordii]|uniref:Mitochondrial adenine nucleotide transporter BTL3 n=1 Tax=Tripterygium wilfordii TaxID=458696 RepID=A0A7J7D1N0_TRIWF|nr:mitochondrial adenine nucleotide transporter BTL3 [Tripterygium wilfordii]
MAIMGLFLSVSLRDDAIVQKPKVLLVQNGEGRISEELPPVGSAGAIVGVRDKRKVKVRGRGRGAMNTTKHLWAGDTATMVSRKQLLRLSVNEETTNSERFIAGAAAGMMATVLCLPLDTLCNHATGKSNGSYLFSAMKLPFLNGYTDQDGSTWWGGIRWCDRYICHMIQIQGQGNEKMSALATSVKMVEQGGLEEYQFFMLASFLAYCRYFLRLP